MNCSVLQKDGVWEELEIDAVMGHMIGKLRLIAQH